MAHLPLTFRGCVAKDQGSYLTTDYDDVRALHPRCRQHFAGTAPELADLAEEIHGYIGWPAKQKRQARQALIAAIRAKT